ncbi:MAG TPA: hemolysin family protein [Spirochaetota bacterium]|nr:hemolysin family protein [Spirochaetota bacterium]
MSELVLVIIGLLAVSFICSVLESVILSITRPYIQFLVDEKNRSAKILEKMKGNIEEPISAILTLNTISHTVGAAVSGALALQLFGSRWMALFSAVLTLLILVFSEIIPKTLGAHYWKSFAPVSAYILRAMVFVLKPLIVPVHYLSHLFMKENPSSMISRAEVINYVRLGYYQGILDDPEVEIVENLFSLQSIRAKDIMTPRTVVFWLPENSTVESVIKKHPNLGYSRIPLYDPHENTVEGIVMTRDIMKSFIKQKYSKKLKALAQKPEFVIETFSVFRLLNLFTEKKTHMAVVLNEYGDYVGIVTLEDALESLLGKEIVDEFDRHEDMQKLAQQRAGTKHGVRTDT